MKLIFCKTCGDIRKLFVGFTAHCFCGASSGAYEDDGLNAWHTGPSKMLGIANPSFGVALKRDDHEPITMPGGSGWKFDAFIIPEVAPTVERRA